MTFLVACSHHQLQQYLQASSAVREPWCYDASLQVCCIKRVCNTARSSNQLPRQAMRSMWYGTYKSHVLVHCCCGTALLCSNDNPRLSGAGGRDRKFIGGYFRNDAACHRAAAIQLQTSGRPHRTCNLVLQYSLVGCSRGLYLGNHPPIQNVNSSSEKRTSNQGKNYSHPLLGLDVVQRGCTPHRVEPCIISGYHCCWGQHYFEVEQLNICHYVVCRISFIDESVSHG